MTNKVTAEEVFAAADALVAAGQEPTQEKVRALLGGRGSMSTINKNLRLWRTKRDNEVQAIAAELTLEQQQSFLSVLADVAKTIRTDFETQLAKLRAAQRHQEETNAADLTAACDEADRLAEELSASKEATRIACEALAACKADFAVLQAEQAHLSAERLQDKAVIAELRSAVAEFSKIRAEDLDAAIERRVREADHSSGRQAV